MLGDIFKGGFFAGLAVKGLNLVTSKIKQLAGAVLGTVNEINKLSVETGLTTDEVQEMQYVTTALDGSVDLLARSQARLTRSMAEARDGTAQYKEAFDKLGLSVTDTSGNLKTASDFMYEVLDALGQVASETERDAIALEIFGRSAQELNPLIKAGGDEIKRLREEARQTGAVMSKEAVEAIDSLGDSIDLVKQRITAFIGEGLARLMGVGRETVASLTESARALDKVNEEYEKTATHTAAVATVALDYVDRLEELEKQGLSTAEAQEEYRAIVAKINSLLPDLNLKIDEQTGLLQTSTQAIRDNISAWKEQAMAQALQERYRDIIKAQADAMAELTENEIKHAEAQAEVAANSAQLDVVYRQVAELFGRTGDEAEKLGAALDNWTLGEITHLALELGVSLGNLVDEISKYRNELIDAEKKEKLYSAAIEESKKILEEHKEEVRIAEEATKDLLGITDEATDATKDNARAVELNTETLENYIATTRKLNNDITKLNSALKEQAENGRLSVSTILDLIEAGYAAALQIDGKPDGPLNTEAYGDRQS